MSIIPSPQTRLRHYLQCLKKKDGKVLKIASDKCEMKKTPANKYN